MAIHWGIELGVINSWAICPPTDLWWPESFKTSWKNVLNNIHGVIVDWVSGHFIINDDALAYYDGT